MSLCMDSCKAPLHLPVCMDSGSVPLSLDMSATRHRAYSDGITYSALSENLLILTTETCKTSLLRVTPSNGRGL